MADNTNTNLLINASIVMLGAGFNPSKYSADSLIEKGIVPSGWKVVSNLTTPIAAQSVFEKGAHQFTVEPHKALIAQTANFNEAIEKSAYVGNAKRFADSISHISVNAVGSNFLICVEMDNATAFLKKRFISPDILEVAGEDLTEAAATFVFSHDNAAIKLIIAAGEASFPGPEGGHDKKLGLVINVNVHRELDPDSTSAVKASLDKIRPDYDRAMMLIRSLLG